MRILHTVEFYEPSVGGAQEVVRQVSEGLVERGHEVTVATTALPERSADVVRGVRIVGFRAGGNAVRGYTGEIEEYRRFLREGSFDVMLNYAAQQWASDGAFELVPSLPYASVLAPCGFSGLFEPSYAEYFQSLPEVLRGYDLLVLHSSTYRDADVVRDAAVENIAVIPNGASEAEFDAPVPGFRTQFGIDPDEPLVVTVGSHTGLKGHARAIEAVRAVRSGRLTLAILGNESPGGCGSSCRRRARTARLLTRGRMRLIVADLPRPLILSALAEADVVIHASSIECAPLVLYEALAAGTPFVASRAGNSEEIATSSGGGLTVATEFDRRGYANVSIPALAGAVESLLADRSLREEMGVAGRAHWRRFHTWSRICEQYEAAYLAALGARASR